MRAVAAGGAEGSSGPPLPDDLALGKIVVGLVSIATCLAWLRVCIKWRRAALDHARPQRLPSSVISTGAGTGAGGAEGTNGSQAHPKISSAPAGSRVAGKMAWRGLTERVQVARRVSTAGPRAGLPRVVARKSLRVSQSEDFHGVEFRDDEHTDRVLIL